MLSITNLYKLNDKERYYYILGFVTGWSAKEFSQEEDIRTMQYTADVLYCYENGYFSFPSNSSEQIALLKQQIRKIFDTLNLPFVGILNKE